MRDFLAPFDEGHWIKGNLTIEMDVTLHLPILSKVINIVVPYSVETLLLLT